MHHKKMNGQKAVFVTVGTTKFDKLIETITRDDVLKVLNKKGFNRMILQHGRTEMEIERVLKCGFEYLETFSIEPSIFKYIQSADLIISHAGAGTCLEVLEARKPLIVVTNELLMDNHQLELADQLSEDNYLYKCTCDSLPMLLETVDLLKLRRSFHDKSEGIADKINYLMGYSNSD